jgi:hypothetical protein
MHKEAGQADRLITGGDRGDEGLLLSPQTCKHVVKDLFISERVTQGSHGVSIALHLVVVGGGCHVSLLDVGEMVVYLHDLCTILGRKHDV